MPAPLGDEAGGERVGRPVPLGHGLVDQPQPREVGPRSARGVGMPARYMAGGGFCGG